MTVEPRTDVHNTRIRTVDGVTTIIVPGCTPVRVGGRSVCMVFVGQTCVFLCDYDSRRHVVTTADVKRVCADAEVPLVDVTVEDDSGSGPDIQRKLA